MKRIHALSLSGLILSCLILAACGSRSALPGTKPVGQSGATVSGNNTGQSTPSSSPSPQTDAEPGVSLSLNSLASGNSRHKTAGTRLVESQDAFETLWQEHSGSSAILPEVDFATETVVAVFAGQKPTGGYSIKITSIKLNGDELLVSYQETAPVKGSLNSQVLTAPAHIVKIDKNKANGDFKSVRFLKQ